MLPLVVTLTASELRRAVIVARTFLPLGMFGGVTDDLDVAAALRHDAKVSPWHTTLLLRIGFLMVWLAPLWLRLRLRTFGGLELEAREAILERLLASRVYLVRMTTNFLKLVLCTRLLGDRRLLAHVNAYGLGEPLDGAALPRSAA